MITTTFKTENEIRVCDCSTGEVTTRFDYFTKTFDNYDEMIKSLDNYNKFRNNKWKIYEIEEK